MKFTPGPWEINGQMIWNPQEKVGNIAHVYCKGVSENKLFDIDEMGQANARLIAAAPDLLEALKRYINIPVIPDMGSEKDLIDTINMSLAAIAAAEGGD